MNHEPDPRLQLVPPDATPRLWMFALCVLLPCLVTATALAWGVRSGEPLKLVQGSLPLTAMIFIGLVLATTVGLWWFLDRMMQRHQLQLDDARLKVRTSFYSIDLALPELKLDEARVVDLHERTEFKPVFKTNGYAVPGFKSGHFRLRNRHKAFVAIVGERRALWLPTTRGQGLLLQPRQPEALLERLRELADNHARR